MHPRTAAFALFSLGCSLPLAAEEPLPELPVLRLDLFEPEIRTQIEQAARDAQARPRDATASGQLGMTLHSYEQYELAATCYARARQLAPRELRWQYYYGLVEMAQGAHAEAALAFKAALLLQPEDLPSKLRLAEVLLALRRFRESQALYEAALVALGAMNDAEIRIETNPYYRAPYLAVKHAVDIVDRAVDRIGCMARVAPRKRQVDRREAGEGRPIFCGGTSFVSHRH